METATTDRVADAYRRWGYLQADLDRLGRLQPVVHPEIAAVQHESTAARWRRVYCGPIGAEFLHLPEPERCAWIAARLEAEPVPPDRRRLVERVAETELFERFLHARYAGSKRYSLEGAAALVPLLDAILDAGAARGVEVCLVAMSHRGRLTVMTRVVNVPPSSIFAGYEDFEPRTVLGSGDVKYHLGATGEHRTASGRSVAMHLVSNPSHLEAVDPVLQGRLRARQQRLGAGGRRRVLGIALHGDAAFAGQGITAETLNLAALPGYEVGGTIHIVVNNLIGFTAEPRSLHSSRFATEVAKRLSVPIFHVNGEDPEAVVRVGAIAADYRAAFGSDVVVDLIGYRRYGHSEVDDPTATQPLLYRQIEARPMLWQSYATGMGVTAGELQALEERIRADLAAEQERGRALQKKPVLRTLPSYWDTFVGGPYEPGFEVDTGVPAERLAALGDAMVRVPEGFVVHPKLAKMLELRREMTRGTRPVDWGTAELLAFGSLLADGRLVRLTGQDCRRGTFNQRHAVLVDQETGAEHLPLQHLHAGQGPFEIWDSPLSEAAVLGFEYGFSRDWPDGLVCWEAQFGDFANGAQIVLDQFLSAGEDKWYLLSGLVVLLPHGFEGQGPEHSSARLERFLQLAGEDNLQICQPSTAAQHFHLLRRQALRRWRKPLVVMTPKGYLRAPATAAPRAALATGRFQPVLADPECPGATRVLCCSGKIAHELRAERTRRGLAHEVAVVALEQLYPWPEREVAAALALHPCADKIVWVQEEPANMGALFFVRPLLQQLAGHRHVTTIKRTASASPATGSPKAHALEQQALLELAFAHFD
jgi:2-oxoglutarate dehydrogenase E1 component